MTMYACEVIIDNATKEIIIESPDVGFGTQSVRISREQAVILARFILNITEDDE